MTIQATRPTSIRRIEDHPVPKDGKFYPAFSLDPETGAPDRGVVWWVDEEGRYGWIAEGKTFDPDSITHWTDFPQPPRRAEGSDPMKHELKSWPEFFKPMKDGSKPFDLRKNDRHYKVADTVVFREWDDRAGKFTGESLQCTITFVMEGVGSGGIPPLHGLNRGYVILGLSTEF